LTGVICQDEQGQEYYPQIIDGGDEFYFIGAYIEVEPFQDLTCVFTNEPTGSITIVKDADPPKGQEFAFSGDLGDFSLPGDGAHSEDYLSPGSYTIAETVAGGWGLQDVWCHIADIPEEGADFEFDPRTNSASVRLAPGQDVVCTFFNEMATAITLPESSLVAEGRAGQVTLRWETVMELDNAGFNVLRATAPDGPWTQVNQALIAAEGDTVSGASYRFADAPGYGVFYYQLEDVDYYGATTLHGPVTIDLGSAIRAPHFRPAPPEF